MEFLPPKKDKRSFRDIVLSHLNKILELSCDEFKGGYWKKEVKGNLIEEVYVPDSRKKMIQVIEFWGYILRPRFNKDMKEKYKKIREKLSGNLKQFNDNKIDKEKFVIRKLKIMKNLFEELNFLLSDLDYLKGEVFSQKDIEDAGGMGE